MVLNKGVGLVAKLDPGAKFGTEAAKILIDQPEIDRHAGDVGGGRGEIAANH